MLAGILTERRRSLEKSKTVSGAPQLWRPRHTTGVTGYRIGAGEGNRTLVVSLGSFCSTIELHPRSLIYSGNTGSLARLGASPRTARCGDSFLPFDPLFLKFALLLGLSLFFGLAFEEFHARAGLQRPGG